MLMLKESKFGVKKDEMTVGESWMMLYEWPKEWPLIRNDHIHIHRDLVIA